MTIERIRELLDRGAPWEACDAFRAPVVDAARTADPELLYWGALAHARAGAAVEAHALLDRAQPAAGATGAASLLAEILSLRGRLCKDAVHRLIHRAASLPHRASTTHAPARDALQNADVRGEMERARAAYLAAWRIAHDPFPGVNVATLSLLLGDHDSATRFANDAIARLGDEPRSVWDLASGGEARLIIGDTAAARMMYAAAFRACAGNAGMVASMRRQLALLARVLPAANEAIGELPAPSVLAFSGHMVDAPDRAAPRFPPCLVPQVAQIVADRLRAQHEPIVFSSAACGADLLCIEAAFAVGAEVNLVLPFDREEFVATSVATGGSDWVTRFDAALVRAHRVVVASGEHYLGDDVLFDHGARMVEGMAKLRADQLQTEPSLLCVIDSSEPTPLRTGGTGATLERWRRSGFAADVIDLRKLRELRDVRASRGNLMPRDDAAPVSADASPRRTGSGRRTLKSMLFADFAGYSRLDDAVIPTFQRAFLDAAASLIETAGARPLEAKTWGDALYAVFDEAFDAADFALRFAERMRGVDWAGAGAGDARRVRVALHAGPVFCALDPVMRCDSYFGANVTRAARIEPITPPGVVYASEAFAATLALNADGRFALEYVGTMALAKSYGEARVYRLERAILGFR